MPALMPDWGTGRASCASAQHLSHTTVLTQARAAQHPNFTAAGPVGANVDDLNDAYLDISTTYLEYST